jgi:DNA-directed RNA polymerase alpha subunit
LKLLCPIAHLSQGGKLDMQIKVEKGRGYVPGTMRKYGDEPTKAIGRIVLDASFSPVRRVSYSVENARVEQRTDLDKLVMEIETNGAIAPEEAIRQSARILVEQLAMPYYAQPACAKVPSLGAARRVGLASFARLVRLARSPVDAVFR